MEQTTRGSSICIELESLQEETGQLDGPEIDIKRYRLPSLLTVTVTVFVGRGILWRVGSLVDSTHFVQRVACSNPALAAT